MELFARLARKLPFSPANGVDASLSPHRHDCRFSSVRIAYIRRTTPDAPCTSSHTRNETVLHRSASWSGESHPCTAPNWTAPRCGKTKLAWLARAPISFPVFLNCMSLLVCFFTAQFGRETQIPVASGCLRIIVINICLCVAMDRTFHCLRQNRSSPARGAPFNLGTSSESP
jgi:hypothetical protein